MRGPSEMFNLPCVLGFIDSSLSDSYCMPEESLALLYLLLFFDADLEKSLAIFTNRCSTFDAPVDND